MTRRKIHILALVLSGMMSATAEVSSAASADLLVSEGNRDLSAALPILPADHPMGNGATVTLASLDRATNLREATVSTFIVDYAPGGSAILHRMPASGYVLVHVLSGAIRAFAWQAGVGTYRTGETWAEPAFAYSIATANASTHDSARAVVVLVTGAQDETNQGDMKQSEAMQLNRNDPERTTLRK